MPDLSSAFKILNDSSSDVSCHYLISRKGLVYNLLCPNFKAWHAGKSEWKNDKNLNDLSIGIELENRGHEHGYTEFTKNQYKQLKKLLNFLCINFKINAKNIIYHSDISPNRKKDPGEKFYLKEIGINRFHINFKRKRLSVNKLLKMYGFSNNYIKSYKNECIIAVKRFLNYKKINSNISKRFIKDFNNLFFTK